MGATQSKTRPQPGASGGPSNGMFPSQIAGQAGQAQMGNYNMPSMQMMQPSNPLTQMTGSPPPQPGLNGSMLAPGGGFSSPIQSSNPPSLGAGGGIYDPGGSSGVPGQGFTPTGVPMSTRPEQIGGNWFTGKTYSVPQMPGDIAGLRHGLGQFLGQDYSNMFSQTPGAPPMVNAGDPMQVMAQMLGMGNRGMIRDVNSQNLGSIGPSVDQMGGANSAFFNNMVGQLSPAFDMQRQLAIAAGKEHAGNLTGSGYANALGNNLNRTLGDQQAQLANYAMQGLGLGVQQQGLQNQRDISSAGNYLQAGMANQGADTSFANQLLQRQLANQQTGMQAQLANQGARQAYDFQNSNLAQNRYGQIYDANTQNANNNANRYAQLLQAMATAGVGPPQLAQKSGASSLLGGLLSGAGSALGAFGLGKLF